MDQMAKGKETFQGMSGRLGVCGVEVDMHLIQMRRFRVEKSGGGLLYERMFQMGMVWGQSLRMCNVVSGCERQRGQVSSLRMCLLWRLYLVGRQSW